MNKAIPLFIYTRKIAKCTLVLEKIYLPTAAFHQIFHQVPFYKKISYNEEKTCIQNRFLSAVSVKNPNIFIRLKKKLSSFFSKNTKLRLSGCLVYEKCADNIDCYEFFEHFKLPDTFNSWFLVVQLHVWMCIVVTISEDKGRFFRNCIVDSMWEDVEIRLSRLVTMKPSLKKMFLRDLVGHFQAALISYDEGILNNDAVLAASAWRSFFAYQSVDPKLLESIVFYIRKQVSHLDALNTEDFMYRGSVSFLPLNSIFQNDS